MNPVHKSFGTGIVVGVVGFYLFNRFVKNVPGKAG